MQQIQAKTQLRTKKMVLTAMLACLAFVLNTYVYFPSMAPFQHFVDVIAAVLLGPWYACAAAFLGGIMRMMSGRPFRQWSAPFLDPSWADSSIKRPITSGWSWWVR